MSGDSEFVSVAKKPLGVRVLEQRGISHTVVEFPDEIRSAAGVAETTGIGTHEVLKTLVVLEDGSSSSPPYLVLAAADVTVDLKLLARHLGVKKLAMAAHKDAERLTGLRVGGISALALFQKRWPVLVDDGVRDLDAVLVSAGARGFDVRLAVTDLMDVTGASFAPVAERLA